MAINQGVFPRVRLKFKAGIPGPTGETSAETIEAREFVREKAIEVDENAQQVADDRSVVVPVAEQVAEDRIQTGLDRAATSSDRTQTGLDKSAAQTARTQAEAARDAAQAGANVYASVSAGLAATMDGGQFVVPDGNRNVRYERVNASTATRMTDYPTSLLVATGQRRATALQHDSVGSRPVTIVAVGSTSPDTGTGGVGATFAHSNTWASRKAYLDEVSFRASASGAGELQVFQPFNATQWECTHVVPVAYQAGVNTFSAALGSLPQDIPIQTNGFVAVLCSSGGGLRYATGTGQANRVISPVISGKPVVVGDLVGRGSAQSAEIALKYSASLVNEAEPLLVSARNGMVAAALAYGAGRYPETVPTTIGSIITPTGSFALGGFIAPVGAVADAARVSSVELSVAGGGRLDLRVYEPVNCGAFRCVATYPLFCINGTNLFSVAGTTLPPDIIVKKGGFFAVKTYSQGIQYAPGTAGWRSVSGDTGIGSVVTIADTFNNLQTNMDVTYDVAPNSLASRVTALEAEIDGEAIIAEAVRRVAINYGLSPLLTSMASYTSGDSTVASYNGTTSLLDLTGSIRNKVQVAVPGHTIAQQKSAWNALTVDPALVGWVAVQIGLNDMNPAEAASVAIARLQDLVATIRSKVGSKPLFVSKMIPCRQRWIDLYGSTDGPVAQAKWVSINEAIAGGGPSPITGVDGRVVAHVPLLDDGSGNLRPAYDTGDHIHPNNAGRGVNATAIVDALHAAGMIV